MHPVRSRRERVGLSQLALADRVGLARQSLSAIEAGRVTPSVEIALKLARALDCRVEELFGLDDGAPSIDVSSLELPRGSRVVLGRVSGRLVGHSIDGRGAGSNVLSADGIVREAHRVEGLGPLDALDRTVFLAGCAPALGALADRLNRARDGARYVWLAMSSSAALEALREKKVHVAGVHFGAAEEPESNLGEVGRRLPQGGVVLHNLLCWDAGLALPRGNPKKIRNLTDLTRRGVRFVARDVGSAARKRFDRVTKAAGIASELASNVVAEAGSIGDATTLVALGAADASLTVASSARSAGLEFLTLGSERFDLVIDRDALGTPAIDRLLDALAGHAVRAEFAALGDDASQSGRRSGELEPR